MYWCINVWYTLVPMKDCGLKLITPWFMRDGVNTPTFGVNECQITVKKVPGGGFYTDTHLHPPFEIFLYTIYVKCIYNTLIKYLGVLVY